MTRRDGSERIVKQQELFTLDKLGYFINEEHMLYKLKAIYDFDRWYP